MNALDIALGSLWGIAVAQTVFVLVVGFKTEWRQTIVTRALFVKSSVLCLTVANSLVNYHWPHPYEVEASAILLFALFLAVVYQDLATLYQLFWLDRRP
jgi:hypothetical protein